MSILYPILQHSITPIPLNYLKLKNPMMNCLLWGFRSESKRPIQRAFLRTDFITNSSSSSYIIGVHGELTEKKLLKIFGVPKDSLLYSFAKELAGFIVGDVKEWSKEDILEEWEELWGVMPKIFDSGMTCYVGSASSEGYDMEQTLCSMDISYESVQPFLRLRVFGSTS